MILFLWNWVYTGFWGRWLQIRYRIFKIQNSGFNMAAAKMKNRDNIDKNINLAGFWVSRAE